LLTIGQKAPNFSLEGDDGQIHSLKNYHGKPLVIFFYPKDLTPGCTAEACEFSDTTEQFRSFGAEVIGISKDSLASHIRFKSKHNLRLLLLSDPDLAVHKQYGAYGDKTLYGLFTAGVIRSTILIDKNGDITRTWYKVRVKNHVKAVLEALTKLSNE
jgi:thioredoxin-dependent peroxiredoxin